MKLLLDTNVFLWTAVEPARLSPRARAHLADLENIRIVSAVTPWELAIKMNSGQLGLPTTLHDFVHLHVGELNAEFLSIEPEHALGLRGLPLHHRDPFDRMLVVQARIEGLKVVTSDDRFRAYDIETIW